MNFALVRDTFWFDFGPIPSTFALNTFLYSRFTKTGILRPRFSIKNLVLILPQIYILKARKQGANILVALNVPG